LLAINGPPIRLFADGSAGVAVGVGAGLRGDARERRDHR